MLSCPSERFKSQFSYGFECEKLATVALDQVKSLSLPKLAHVALVDGISMACSCIYHAVMFSLTWQEA